MLRDDQWERMEPLLSGSASNCSVTGKENRLFLEAVLWIWRWEIIFSALSNEADFGYLMIDGSIAHVHQHGAPKKTHRKQKRLASHEVV